VNKKRINEIASTESDPRAPFNYESLLDDLPINDDPESLLTAELRSMLKAPKKVSKLSRLGTLTEANERTKE